MKKVRVRFAPSPTGKLHIGGVRTALYNYLFAKKHGGDFILRIEDTDTDRFDPTAEKYIIDALTWCGIMPTEGVGDPAYKQSVRNGDGPNGIYWDHVFKLTLSGKAYFAFDTPEALETIRNEYESRKKVFTYNAYTRDKMNNSLNMDGEDVAKFVNGGTPFVVRLLVPKEGEITVDDIVRGKVTVKTSSLDDKILWKSNGMPSYHLANVVDDHLMEISHVIRGEEWLPSAPFHALLYDMLGWERPAFAHVPLILKPDGKGKLSKRDGLEMKFPVFPLEWKNSENDEVYMGYKETGYLPEAMLNTIALLGWNPGNDLELMTLDEMVDKFTLERVNKAGARFDAKTMWFQKHYILKADPDRLAVELIGDPNVAKWIHDNKKDISGVDDWAYLVRICAAMREKTSFVPQFYEMGKYFFEKPATVEVPDNMKLFHANIVDWLTAMNNSGTPVTHDEARTVFDRIVSITFTDPRDAGKYLRDALTGMKAGPPIFDVISIIGAAESLSRMTVSVAA